MITIHFNDTTLDVQESDDSYRYRSLMGDHNLTLKFSLPEYVEIPVGAWCEYMAIRYTLAAPANIKKNGTRDIEYTLIMESAQYQLNRYKLRNTVDKRLKFSMCATPKEYIQVIVDNLNQRDSGWAVGDCIVSTEKTIAFDHSFVSDALQSVADTFNSEWEIVGKTIHLKKVEYFKDDPLPLSYGKGNGFVPGVGRTTETGSRPVEILFVQGGSQNIDRSKYGSAELLLPKSQTLEYEGRTYISDADGYSIRRQDKAVLYNNEDSLDCSEIYPSRVGKVTKVEVIDEANNFYDIIDNTIPENLNYNDYLIEGENMTIIFQSGMLAGDDKAFELKYNHAERRFEIVPQEIDGLAMPGGVYIPHEGDTYAIFGCMLPDAYICDNATKTGASWDMFREAARYLYENEDTKFTFSGELQGMWAKRNWLKVGGKLVVGGYVLFTDNQFAPDGVKIRITGIKDYLTSPYAPTVELSNSVSGKSLNSTLNELENGNVIVDENQKKIIQFTKRRFRDSLETIDMLEQALLENFTNSINPIAVQTMQMLVGDESLQFRFVNSKTNPVGVAHSITYDNTTKQLTAAAGIIQHLTIGISSLSSSHAASEYRYWDMPEYTSGRLDNGETKYYLYAKVSKTAQTGSFLLSETAIKLEGVSGYYHLLVGVLNSEYDGERSFVTLYGFSEILPGRITTDRVVSGDGNSYFDMVANAMKLGSVLDFNSEGDGKLRLKGTLVQSQSGEENYIGCFRGKYNSLYTYYQGDEVTYTVNNNTSTYRYINATPSRGILPTNTVYWQIIAQGSKGENGADGTSVNIKGNARAHYATSEEWAAEISLLISPVLIDKQTYTSSGESVDEYCIVKKYGRPTVGHAPGWMTIHAADGDAYIMESEDETIDGCLFVAGGEGWTNVGIIKGDPGIPGAPGEDADYYELRYAKNGSTTSPPSLSKTSVNPSGWTTTQPTLSAGQYLWLTIAKKSADGKTLVQQWSTPVRITPYDGKDGADGKSPAMVYRGEYNSSGTYYGNQYRLDCVKYNGTYFIARIDAGTFTGYTPSNTSKWNPFGASFESVATQLLLAENANIAGWIFRNNRLESQNGDIYLDGVKGDIRTKGTVQFSTGYTGNFSDVNIFYLPAITSDKTITMGYEREDVGKVCRLYNSSPFGGATYKVRVCAFGISDNFTDATIGSDKGMRYDVLVPPQTAVELTCYELPKTFDGTTYDLVARWDVSGRFGTTDFVTGGAVGRFPLVLGMGTITMSGAKMSVSGYFYDGRSINSALTITRAGSGNYKFSWASGVIPSGYQVILSPLGDIDRLYVYQKLSTSFRVYAKTLRLMAGEWYELDSQYTDVSFEFIIFGPYWWYNMK